MAEVAEMGEVDEMHSKEEGVVVNGDISNDVDMESQGSQDSIKKPSIAESMDVDEDSENDSENENDEDLSESKENPEENGSEDDANEENHTEDSSIATENENPSSLISEDGNSQEAKEDEETGEEVEDEEEEEEEDGVVNDDQNSANVDEEQNDHEGSQPDTDPTDSSDTSDDSQDGSVHAEEPQKDKDTTSIQTIEDHESVKSIDHEDSNTNSHKSSSEVTTKADKGDNSLSSTADATKNGHHDEPIELNDSAAESDGDDVMVVETPKENGTVTEVIDLDATPEKKIPSPKAKEIITPRRSSRNINKNKSYIEKEETPPPPSPVHDDDNDDDESEESDIEEVLPQDPLAVSDAITVERIPPAVKKTPKDSKSATIVVKDTKRLVEIAAKSNSSPPTIGKKEPTLVIIDTNSILSGRGPVPANKQQAPVKPTVATTNYTSMLPMALPAQGMYPPNMRATITPIPISSNAVTSPMMHSRPSPAIITPATPPTPLLPTLTDDMFVVEAPSFIVPYVYEKPPMKDFKEFVKDYKEQLQKEEAEAKVKVAKEKKERKKKKKANEEVDGEYKAEESEDDSDDSIEDEVVPEKKKEEDPSKKPYSYFESPLGKFFIDIGFNMVQEYVQTDLLKQQKRKRDRENGTNPETNKTIASLVKSLEYTKENNEHFKMTVRKCEFCNFKTESALAMSYHLETPHMKNFIYKCNFCAYEVRSPHDILFHMEAEHAVRGHLERAPAFHQCPNCPFEDNQKGKLSRHLVTCMRKFKPERNLEPPVDWEPPAKIPRVPKMRAQGLNATAAAYQALSKTSQYQFLSKMQLQSTANSAMQRGRGRPTLGPPVKTTQQVLRPSGMVFKSQTMSGGSVLVPTNYQLSGNQVFQVVGGQDTGGRLGHPGHMAFVPNIIPSASSTINMQNSTQPKKPNNTPSISITPLPRGTTATPSIASKPGDTNSKNSFVICEICDGYIKDLEQLRNHMQWIHKIKIHPKMIYNRPPLNCQKCQFRFFTDQGLERHLLGSHGLVTSSMQDAANKSKDSGRCPVCGRVYQWKLLNHVARDHHMVLKPAHLSYKCTVCTATFGMYKQFENHVYSAHSVVAKRVMDKKHTTTTSAASSPSTNAAATTKADIKPLKINDEITIIPQPAKSSAATNGPSKEGSPASTGSSNSRNSGAGTSKNAESESSGNSRAERLARRNANQGD